MNDDDIDSPWRLADEPPPVDFSDRVMHRIAALPLPLRRRPARWRPLVQALALIPAAVLGASQVLGFLLGLWTVTAAH